MPDFSRHGVEDWQSGQPEVREYQAFGVLGDDQIGQPSDITSATFAG